MIGQPMPSSNILLPSAVTFESKSKMSSVTELSYTTSTDDHESLASVGRLALEEFCERCCENW